MSAILGQTTQKQGLLWSLTSRPAVKSSLGAWEDIWGGSGVVILLADQAGCWKMQGLPPWRHNHHPPCRGRTGQQGGSGQAHAPPSGVRGRRCRSWCQREALEKRNLLGDMTNEGEFFCNTQRWTKFAGDDPFSKGGWVKKGDEQFYHCGFIKEGVLHATADKKSRAFTT